MQENLLDLFEHRGKKKRKLQWFKGEYYMTRKGTNEPTNQQQPTTTMLPLHLSSKPTYLPTYLQPKQISTHLSSKYTTANKPTPTNKINQQKIQKIQKNKQTNNGDYLPSVNQSSPPPPTAPPEEKPKDQLRSRGLGIHPGWESFASCGILVRWGGFRGAEERGERIDGNEKGEVFDGP